MDLEKLIQMALASGAKRPCTSPVLRAQGWDWIEFKPEQLPAFCDGILADAAGDVEPVAWLQIQGGFSEPSSHELSDDEIERGWTQEPLYSAATVSALKAERDALRDQLAKALEFPYSETFNAIAAATNNPYQDAIGISVSAFKTAYKAAIAAGGKT